MIFSICPLSIVGPTRLFICPDIIWTLSWGPTKLNKIMCSMTNYVARNILWLPLIMMSSSRAGSSIFRVLYLPPHSLHRGVEDDRCATPGTLFITKRWDSHAPKSSQGVTGLFRFLGHLLQKNKIYDSQMVFYFIIPVRFSLTQCSHWPPNNKSRHRSCSWINSLGNQEFDPPEMNDDDWADQESNLQLIILNRWCAMDDWSEIHNYHG